VRSQAPWRASSPHVRGALWIEVQWTETGDAECMEGRLLVLFLQPIGLHGDEHRYAQEGERKERTRTTRPRVSSGVVVGKLAVAKMASDRPRASATEIEVPLTA